MEYLSTMTKEKMAIYKIGRAKFGHGKFDHGMCLCVCVCSGWGGNIKMFTSYNVFAVW